MVCRCRLCECFSINPAKRFGLVLVLHLPEEFLKELRCRLFAVDVELVKENDEVAFRGGGGCEVQFVGIAARDLHGEYPCVIAAMPVGGVRHSPLRPRGTRISMKPERGRRPGTPRNSPSSLRMTMGGIQEGVGRAFNSVGFLFFGLVFLFKGVGFDLALRSPDVDDFTGADLVLVSGGSGIR